MGIDIIRSDCWIKKSFSIFYL